MLQRLIEGRSVCRMWPAFGFVKSVSFHDEYGKNDGVALSISIVPSSGEFYIFSIVISSGGLCLFVIVPS